MLRTLILLLLKMTEKPKERNGESKQGSIANGMKDQGH